jgi:hypothetical protein
MSGEPITILKLDHTGAEVWRYEGKVLVRGESHIVIEAFFEREDMELGFTVFRTGDRFVESFFADRWYNIFEVHDRDTDVIKGWYCNLCRPARIEGNTIACEDLALDVWVTPEREKIVLDEDEFAALPISEQDRAQVRSALEDVRGQF